MNVPDNKGKMFSVIFHTIDIGKETERYQMKKKFRDILKMNSIELDKLETKLEAQLIVLEQARNLVRK